MYNYFNEDDEEEDKCIYTAKYGRVLPSAIQFDDHSLLGAYYYQYKPEKILFWTDQNKQITGIQTWFKNAVDNNSINSGANKSSLSLELHEFVINSNEYLVKCEIWDGTSNISGIYLETNKGNNFFVGDKKGSKVDIERIKDGKKIIISFFGSYNKYLESFGLHLMEKKEYMKVLFTGYFEFKFKLRKEKYKEEILEKMKNKKFTFQEEAIIKTCLLPSAPFNEVMKFCVI
jgi:hypothetical protein